MEERLRENVVYPHLDGTIDLVPVFVCWTGWDRCSVEMSEHGEDEAVCFKEDSPHIVIHFFHVEDDSDVGTNLSLANDC